MKEYYLKKRLSDIIAFALISTVALVFVLGFSNIKTVSLNLDGQVEEFRTFNRTLAELLESEGIDLEEGSYLSTDLDTKLDRENFIEIRSLKNYTFQLGNDEFMLASNSADITGLLEDAGLVLGEEDKISLDLDHRLVGGENIKLDIYDKIKEEKQLEIAYEVEQRRSDDILKGQSQVIQKGEKGQKTVEVLKTYHNGKLVSIENVKEELDIEPVKEIVLVGNRSLKPNLGPQLASRGGNLKKEDLDLKDGAVFNATAYDLSFASTGKRPGDKYYGISASGTRVRPGTVAVDPKVIPLGTNLYIESLDGWPDYGFARAEDVGGAIKGNKIDLFYESSSTVKKFGRRQVKVYILE